MPVDLSDKEFPYRRALELMSDIECEVKRRLGGRLWAQTGAWRADRNAMRDHLKQNLVGHAARGRELDRMLMTFFEGLCTISLQPVPHAEREPIPIRRSMLSRRHDGVDPIDGTLSDPGVAGEVPVTHATADDYPDYEEHQFPYALS